MAGGVSGDSSAPRGDPLVSWAASIRVAVPSPTPVSLSAAADSAAVDQADLISRIRAADGEGERTRLKQGLPVVTPSGVFTRFSRAGVVEHSGVVYLDVDEVVDVALGGDLKARFRGVQSWAYTWRVAVSPSGRGFGVWVLLADRAPGGDAEMVAGWHARQWAWARHLFEAAFPGLVVDAATKDVCRRQFLGSRFLAGAEQVLLPSPPVDWGAPIEPVSSPSRPVLDGDPGAARDRYLSAAEHVAGSGVLGAYDEWVRFSFACADPVTGIGVGDWDRLCRRAVNYREGQIGLWRGFSGSRRSITGGTLIHMAAEAGWVDPGLRRDPVSAPAQKVRELTDTAAAVAVAGSHRDLMFVTRMRRWFFFDGSSWQVDDDTVMIRRAVQDHGADLMRAAGDPDVALDGKTRGRLLKWGERIRTDQGMRAIVSTGETADWTVGVDALDPPESNHLLAFPNQVTVDLRTGACRASAAGDRITACAGVPYDPDVDELGVHEFLEVIQPDSEDRECLLRLLGYSMIAAGGEQFLGFAVGSGANGKTTLFEAVRYAFGSYTGALSVEYLMMQRNPLHETGIAGLRGKRFVLAAETSEGRFLDSGRVKNLSGGDRIVARGMRQDFFEFTPTHSLWLCTNNLPRIGDTSDGLWRRVKVVRFPVQIPAGEQDPALPAKFRSTRWAQTLVNLVLAGARRYFESGLVLSPNFVTASTLYRADEDIWPDFLDYGGYMLGDDCRAKFDDLFDRYKAWCLSDGRRSRGRKRFAALLREHGCEPRLAGDGTGRWWFGIGKPRQLAAEF